MSRPLGTTPPLPPEPFPPEPPRFPRNPWQPDPRPPAPHCHPRMTLIRDLIRIPTSVQRGDFVMTLREGVDDSYQLQQTIRRVIGRWVGNRLRRRPMIITVVIEA